MSQALAVAFMAGCLWWVLRELALILPNDRVTASLGAQSVVGSALAWPLAAFGATLLFAHMLLGFAAFALARLTEAAYAGTLPVRRGWLVAGWFSVLVALVMAANATWFPGSIFANEDSWLRHDVAGVKPVALAAAVVAAGCFALATCAVRRIRIVRPGLTAGLAVASLLVLVAVFALPNAGAVAPAAHPSWSSPHVVVVGIDSLRADLVGSGNDAPLTPHIDRFLQGAHRFDDAISPLARTYGSWVTILTGRHPVTTNARVNLMPRALVRERDTLAEALRGRGYRTIYATDEVRFANIDRSFGFDEVATPPVGAVDFLLGYAGDQPLVNLVASTAAGAWLFPSNHGNRAAHVTYEPADFVARLDRSLRIKGPSFIAIHLTLAHWPYTWAGMETPGTPQAYRPAYRRAIEAVDLQFEQVMRVLDTKGVLGNAVVVLLSDHGEALGGPTDSMLRGRASSREVWNSLWGHGTSVLSPHQYGVLLAMRGFGRMRLPGAPARHDWPVSLEDIRPTLEELATGVPPVEVDGVSLYPYLAEPSRAQHLADRVRFTETDFNTPSTLAGQFEASGIVDEAALYYEIDPSSGWVQFRAVRLPELMAQKQRAALTADWLLAAVPGPRGQSQRLVFTSRSDPQPVTLTGPSSGWIQPEARRLHAALLARYPGELPSDSVLPCLNVNPVKRL